MNIKALNYIDINSSRVKNLFTKNSIGIGFALLLAAPLTHSAEISLNNADFTLGPPEVPGWSQDGPSNDSGVADTEGRWSAELAYNSGAVYQTTTRLMTAGNIFNLTFNAKIAGDSDQITARLFRLDPGNVRTTLATLTSPITGAWEPYTLNYTAVAADAGLPIGIEFSNSSAAGWASFDEFALAVDSVEVPLINPEFSANNDGSADNGEGFDQGGTGDIPGWSQLGASNGSGLAERDGLRIVALSYNGPDVYQTTAYAIAGGDKFTLTFNSKEVGGGSNQLTVRLYRLDPGNVRTTLAALTSPITGSWTQYSLTYTAMPADAGLPIGIEFSNSSAVGLAGFDDFVLNFAFSALAIPLINPEFSANNDGSADGLGFDHGGTEEVPGWFQDGDSNDSGVAPTDGRWSAELAFNSGAVYQTTARLMKVGEEFRSSFNAKNSWLSNQITARLYRLDPGNVRTTLAELTSPVTDSWIQYNLTYTAVAADAGLPIGIEFKNSSADGWASFDEFTIYVLSSALTYANWIGEFNVGLMIGLNDDPDKDGVPNGLENLFGTTPSGFSSGLNQVSGNVSTLVFQHSLSNSPVNDLTGSYQWSTNLTNWNSSGASQEATTVTITSTILNDTMAPANDLVEVSATVSTGSAPKLFVRYKATQP